MIPPSTSPPPSLRLRWHRRLRELATSHSDPAALGAAVALGIFVGCSPFYGFHTLLVIGLAAILRLNPLAAALGAQVSFPPLGLAIVGTEVALGEWLRYGHWSMPTTSGHGELSRWIWTHALLSWVIGSVPVGAVLAVAGGLAAWMLFRVWQARRRDREGG